MLKTKSVQSPIEPKSDGLRILATRFRGRGMSSTFYDAWMPSLGPSEELLAKVMSGAITWAAFSKAYQAELFEDGPVDRRCRTIKNHGQKFTLRLIKQLAATGNVTLMCHCEEEETQCHRHLLRALILSSKV